MVIVRLRSIEICMPMSLGRDRGSATKKLDKVRTLGRVRLRVCECVSHDTRHFRRIHASGLDRGSLLPLQKVDIPSTRVFKAAPVPWSIAQLFTNFWKFLRTGCFGLMRDAKGDHFSSLNRAIVCRSLAEPCLPMNKDGNHFRRQQSARLSIIVEIAWRQSPKTNISIDSTRPYHATMRCARPHEQSSRLSRSCHYAMPARPRIFEKNDGLTNLLTHPSTSLQ